MVLLALLIALRFRYSSWKEYTVRLGDQLPMIAKQAGIDWKKLVQVNKLKEPVVEPGFMIRVPKKFQPEEAKPPIIGRSHEEAIMQPQEAVATTAVETAPEEPVRAEAIVKSKSAPLLKQPTVKSRVIPVREEGSPRGEKKGRKPAPRKRTAKKPQAPTR